MTVVVLTHVDSEGPGLLRPLLEQHQFDLKILRLHAGDPVPDSLRPVKAVLCMGGPMNVYEEEAHPFLRSETAFLREAVESGVPTLGVCLGAQLIAKAWGAEVVKSPVAEVGWQKILLTNDGLADPLFQGLPGELEVFQWHGDMFRIPEGGRLLATGTDCPNQAFRIKNSFGFQFHIETTGDLLQQWFEHDAEKAKLYKQHWQERKTELQTQAELIVNRFAQLI